MGVMFVIAPCVGCQRLFSFSAERVPSVIVDGVRQPICRSCVDVANPVRVENGLDPIVPLPGAYDSDETL